MLRRYTWALRHREAMLDTLQRCMNADYGVWYIKPPGDALDKYDLAKYHLVVKQNDFTYYGLIVERAQSGHAYLTVECFVSAVTRITTNSKALCIQYKPLCVNGVEAHKAAVDVILEGFAAQVEQRDKACTSPEDCDVANCQLCQLPPDALTRYKCRKICHACGVVIKAGDPSYTKLDKATLSCRCYKDYVDMTEEEKVGYVQGVAPQLNEMEPDLIVRCTHCPAFAHHQCAGVASIVVQRLEAQGGTAPWTCFRCRRNHPPSSSSLTVAAARPNLAMLPPTRMAKYLESGLGSLAPEIEGLIVREVATTRRSADSEYRDYITSQLVAETDAGLRALAQHMWAVTVRVVIVAQRQRDGAVVFLAFLELEEAVETRAGQPGVLSRHALLSFLDTVRLLECQDSSARRGLWVKLLRLAIWYYRWQQYISMRWHASSPGLGLFYAWHGQWGDMRPISEKREALWRFYNLVLGLEGESPKKLAKKLNKLAKKLAKQPARQQECFPLVCYRLTDMPVPTERAAVLRSEMSLTSPPLSHVQQKTFEAELVKALKAREARQASAGSSAKGRAHKPAALQTLVDAAAKKGADAVAYAAGDRFYLVDLQTLKTTTTEAEQEELEAAKAALDEAGEYDENLPDDSEAVNQAVVSDRITLLASTEVSRHLQLLAWVGLCEPGGVLGSRPLGMLHHAACRAMASASTPGGMPS